jgi:hypothetical protein
VEAGDAPEVGLPGAPEPCDWCARPGVVRQHDFWDDHRLICRDPALCDVCFSVWDAPGDVVDAYTDAGLDFVESVERPMEAALAERWREKVERGTRSAEE